MRTRRRGYTLFELLVVLAIIVILAAVAFPSFDAMGGSFRVTQATDMVRARWAEARSHAMSEGKAYRFSVVPNRGNYRIAPDSADYWSGNHGDSSGWVMEGALPRGVRFRMDESAQAVNPAGDTALPVGPVDSGQWQTVAVFLPDGTAQEDREIIFTAAGARPTALKLRALTGAVTVRTLAPHGRR